METFRREPLGRWACAGPVVAWCADAALAGVVVWGRPSLEEVVFALPLLDAYVALGPEAVVLVDGREAELDVDPLIELTTWCLANRHGLHERLKLQVGLTRSGVVGTYPELRPTVSHPIEVFFDTAAAYVRADATRGEALMHEVSACVNEVRGTMAELVKLRALLRENAGNLSLDEASHALALSRRSLQRVLSDARTSFREELARSRSESAVEILSGTSGTLAVVARHMGISVGTLMSTVRKTTGATPSEYRKRQGGTPATRSRRRR